LAFPWVIFSSGGFCWLHSTAGTLWRIFLVLVE